MKKESVLSCIQSTSPEMHIGNYFGAVKNWVDLQNKYECFYGVVDYHAMTIPYDAPTLRKNTLSMLVNLLACGIDPERSALFIQSLVPEHAELCWIFSSIASYGQLTRMTQFKDKSEQIGENDFISVGLFTYPVLQAADILIYKAQHVPVGKDQEQHLELARNIAASFNHRYKPYFPEPKPLFTPTPKILSLADPSKKMSKSLGEKHYIGLFEASESITKKVKTAVTDTGATPQGEMSAGVTNLFEIIAACGNLEIHQTLMNDYEQGSLKYSHLKEAVTKSLIELTSAFIHKRAEILNNIQDVEELARETSKKAREQAQETVREVRELVGLPRR
jgi:tryptophanyl-tRNA synthetase